MPRCKGLNLTGVRLNYVVMFIDRHFILHLKGRTIYTVIYGYKGIFGRKTGTQILLFFEAYIIYKKFRSDLILTTTGVGGGFRYPQYRFCFVMC